MQRFKPPILAVAALTVISLFFAYNAFFLDKYSGSEVTVEIPRGVGLNTISAILEEKGLVKSATIFKIFVFAGGFSGELKAGEYLFEPGVTVNEISAKMRKGDVVQRKVTIPEGYNVYQIANVLEERNIVSREKFLEMVFDSEYTTVKLGLDVENLEGFLFPDTYSFNKNEEPATVIQAMLRRFWEVYNSIETSGNMDIVEAVTRASIIEKETPVSSEKPLVSAVINNRLKKGYRLECDPTVIYAMWERYDGNITKKDLRYDSPYNTYRVFGLPPGPIANPGKESIEAALNPADVNYLYFVSRGDGSHVFSNTYRDHVNAVNRYQR